MLQPHTGLTDRAPCPFGVELGRLAALTRIKGIVAGEFGPLGLRPPYSLLASLADLRPLKLSNPGHNGHHQLADIRCGIAPAFRETNKAALFFSEIMKDVEKNRGWTAPACRAWSPTPRHRAPVPS
jgi:hypothetical protein